MAFRKIINDSEGGLKFVTEQEEELVFDQAPTKDSFNPVTSDGVAKALSVGAGGAQIGEVVPSDTSAENKLVNEKALRELMLNTIGGRTYKTTKIGNQIWLAENLDFKFYGLKIGTDEISSGEPCAAYYNNDEATYGAKGKNYGLLYNKEAHDALNAYKDQLIPGWRVATMDDWQTLFNTVGSTSTAADQLKATTEWGAGAPRTDPYKFTAYPSGTYDTDENSFSGITYYGYWWAVGMYAGGNKTGVIMSPGPNIIYDGAQDRFYNIRLVRDA